MQLDVVVHGPPIFQLASLFGPYQPYGARRVAPLDICEGIGLATTMVGIQGLRWDVAVSLILVNYQ